MTTLYGIEQKQSGGHLWSLDANSIDDSLFRITGELLRRRKAYPTLDHRLVECRGEWVPRKPYRHYARITKGT